MGQEQAGGILLILLANGLRSRAFFGAAKNFHSQRAFLATPVLCRLDLLLTFWSHGTSLSLMECDAVTCMPCYQAAKQARYDKEAVIKFFRLVCYQNSSVGLFYPLRMFSPLMRCYWNAFFSLLEEDTSQTNLLPQVPGPLLQEKIPSFLWRLLEMAQIASKGKGKTWKRSPFLKSKPQMNQTERWRKWGNTLFICAKLVQKM